MEICTEPPFEEAWVNRYPIMHSFPNSVKAYREICKMNGLIVFFVCCTTDFFSMNSLYQNDIATVTYRDPIKIAVQFVKNTTAFYESGVLLDGKQY